MSGFLITRQIINTPKPFKLQSNGWRKAKMCLQIINNQEFVTVPKLSKALAWLSCVRSCEMPEFKAYPWHTLARAHLANYMSIGVVNE